MKKRSSVRSLRLLVPQRSPLLYSSGAINRHCSRFLTNARRAGQLAPTRAFREFMEDQQ